MDAELYLRLEGERQLPAAGIGRREEGLGSVASAFVATGVLESELAGAIVSDYNVAAAIRRPDQRPWLAFMHQQPQPAPLPTVTAPAVALCHREDPEADGSIPYAVLGDDATELAVSYSGSEDWSEVVKRFPKPQGFPQSLLLGDDTGHTEPATFQGGGGGGHWSGRFVTTVPLSQATQWLELGGMRMQLVRSASSKPEPRVEEIDQTSVTAGYLRHRFASAEHGLPPVADDPVIAALIAVGVLAADDPVLAELHAVQGSVLFGAHGFAHARHLAATNAMFGTPPSPPPTDPGLPERWRSIARPVSQSGPAGIVPIGVLTPMLEGVAALLHVLISEPDGFRIDTAEIAGAMRSPQPMGIVEQRTAFAWWAQDDLGGWYRGSWQGWSGDGVRKRGDVMYSPPLDPRARLLRLMPSLATRRVVIDLPLPSWGEQA